MTPRRTRRLARLFSVFGLLLALFGLTNFWLTRAEQRTVLTPPEQALVNPKGEFQMSFVLAGRDYDYSEAAGPLITRGGEQVREFVTEAQLGNRTDTIMYVNIVGNRVYMVSIPRDTVLEVPRAMGISGNRIGINEVYDYPQLYGTDNRADALRKAVSTLLDLPVDYYAIVNIDIFKSLVDAVDGVTLEVPARMYYVDQAGGLTIDLQPGLQHLDGEQAAGFVRYRKLLRGDIDRIDNVKTLAYALLSRLQALNVRAVTAVPKLLETFFAEVDTNISAGALSQLGPRLSDLQLEAVTLPTQDVEDSKRFVRTVPSEVEGFLAGLFGGQARKIAETPRATVMLSNRSGVPGLAKRVKAELVRLGIPAARIHTRQGAPDPVTRVVTTHAEVAAAPFYADLFGVGWQQVDRLMLDEDIEIVLGQNARNFALATPLVTRLAEGGQP